MKYVVILGDGMADYRQPSLNGKTPLMLANKPTIDALAKANVNIRMIDQGSSEKNIIVGVLNTDYEASIKAIYNEFFGDKN